MLEIAQYRPDVVFWGDGLGFNINFIITHVAKLAVSRLPSRHDSLEIALLIVIAIKNPDGL